MSDSNAPAIRAIVAGHGDWAAGLVSALAQITGRGDLFLPLTNRGMSGEQLEMALRAAVDETGASCVFTDLVGGSWTLTARRVMRDRPSLVLVTGANLSMLLDFTFHDSMPPEEAARLAVEKGRSAMTVGGGGMQTGGGRGN